MKNFGTAILLLPCVMLLASAMPQGDEPYEPYGDGEGAQKVCAVLETASRDWGFVAYDRQEWSLEGTKWNDNIGYVHLEKRCYLKAYVDTGFRGTMNNLIRPDDNINPPGYDYKIKSTGWIYNWWKNDISSYRCVCI